MSDSSGSTAGTDSSPHSSIVATAAASPKVNESGLNATLVSCQFCNCKIFLPGVARLVVNRSISVPKMIQRRGDPQGEEEMLDTFWELEDMLHFENVGFTRQVAGSSVKYLACADCDIGPIGLHDTAAAKSFLVASSRVKQH